MIYLENNTELEKVSCKRIGIVQVYTNFKNTK